MLGTMLLLAALTHNPMPLPSFSFAGRVTDYAHIGYDADQKVEVRVKAKDGTLLAKSVTATSGKTGYNFVVDVPVSDTPATGCVTPGTQVDIEFVDPDGVIYKGLVAAGDAVIGKPFDMESLLARVSQLILKSRQVEKKVKIDMISKPTEVHTVSPDEKFLIDVTKLIESHIDEPELSVTNLCELGSYTEKNLYRKIKKLTGQSTVEYIRSIRLKKAALLLQNGNFTVSETMYMVGFSNTSYFSKAFCSQFGKTPKEYQQSFKEQQG